MSQPDPRSQVAQSIEQAIAYLADALVELDSIPAHDSSTIGFVAHAMNNYLSVTDATLALLRHALRDYPDAEVARWLEGLRHLGSMMHHTIGRLVRATSTEDFPLKPDYMNLPRLMERACDHYRVKAAQQQLEIRCRTVADIPPTWGDAVAVAVVADNLLSNAVKFSHPGGEILVQILPGPGGVVASVRDNGPGLSFLEQTRLFQPHLTPASPITPGTPNAPSQGYGIRIAKGLIDRMGGRLWVESEEGRGACFFFRLPYHPPTPPGTHTVTS
jgi:signal transduction histidine kinase